jgi:FkbM family methyltransferase
MMNAHVKKLLRTLQIEFPFLLETKFSLARLVRNWLRAPFEKEFRALSLFPDADNALYLDVGANRGQSTDAILMQKNNARIQLFEPNDLMLEKLNNMFGREQRVILNNFGLGDQNTTAELVVPFYKKWMFDGLASFREDRAKNWLKERVFFYSDRHLSLRKITGHIKKLDDLQLDPFFIKLSIQGYEYNALKGGENTIKKYEPLLLVQSANEKIIDYLKDLGYQFYAFEKGKLVGGVRGYFTFFMTETKARLVRRHIES